jgi:hypothetical protein
MAKQLYDYNSKSYILIYTSSHTTSSSLKISRFHNIIVQVWYKSILKTNATHTHTHTYIYIYKSIYIYIYIYIYILVNTFTLLQWMNFVQMSKIWIKYQWDWANLVNAYQNIIILLYNFITTIIINLIKIYKIHN